MTVTVGVTDNQATKAANKNEDSLTALQLKVCIFIICFFFINITHSLSQFKIIIKKFKNKTKPKNFYIIHFYLSKIV